MVFEKKVSVVQYLGPFEDQWIYIQFCPNNTPDTHFGNSSKTLINFKFYLYLLCFTVSTLSPCVLQHVHKLAVSRFWMFSYIGFQHWFILLSIKSWTVPKMAMLTVSVCINMSLDNCSWILWVQKAFPISPYLHFSWINQREIILVALHSAFPMGKKRIGNCWVPYASVIWSDSVCFQYFQCF